MTARVHRIDVHPLPVAAVQAMTLCSDQVFSRHAHDAFGLGLVGAGAQRSWSGRGWVEARAGDLISVNPGELHDGAPIDGARRWQMLYLAPGLVEEVMAEAGIDAPEITRPVLNDRRLALAFGSVFGRLAGPLVGPQAGPCSSSSLGRAGILDVESEVVGLLALLMASHGARSPARERASPPVHRARQRLDDAPEQAVTLVELARLAGVGRFQLLRGFAREVGITPHAYQLQRRVLLAARLLAAGQRPAEAALAAGFADQSHLTRAFRRQVGLTPARYRDAVGPQRRRA